MVWLRRIITLLILCFACYWLYRLYIWLYDWYVWRF